MKARLYKTSSTLCLIPQSPYRCVVTVYSCDKGPIFNSSLINTILKYYYISIVWLLLHVSPNHSQHGAGRLWPQGDCPC